MDCIQCHAVINQYIDGELGGAMAAEFQAHQSVCADCAEELRDLSALRLGLAHLGDLELELPANFAAEVMTAVASLPDPRLRDKVRELGERIGLVAMPARRRTVALSALTGIAAVVVGLEALYLRRHGEVEA
ncbi:MAG: anti-sigma factor family protein [Thermoleophilia bacterium]